MTIKTVEVLAPGNLPEGYIFDATVDDITFAVTVPAGGVEEGQPIRVAYPVLVMATPIPEEVTSSYAEQPDGTRITETKHPDGTSTIVRETLRIDDGGEYQPLAPTGKFRNGMCDCCEVFCSGRFWMAFCCIGCYMGQIMQRFKLNAFGARGNYKNTCMICTIALTILLVMPWVLTVTIGFNLNLNIFITIWMTIAITLTHMEYRKKYMIPPKCCGETCWGDCCCAFWCGCCLAIQMDRHTHDENVYKYQCCTDTGLSASAPEIV